MLNNSVAACYYPTTVLFVDDDAKYLETLDFLVDIKKTNPKFFTNALAVLDFLKKYKFNSFIQRCITRPEENQFDHRSIDINIKKIWQEVYNSQRFEEVSVLVIDYAMPGMNGLDLAKECRLIKASHFKILLLTGEAEEDKVVEAFNNKIIDKYIRKSSPDFDRMLNDAIYELQKEYFSDLSTLVIDSLTKDPEHPVITWLDEPVFLRLFADICQTQDITEYYLSDAFGSFMFLDINGNPNWLAVKSAEEMQAAYEVVESSTADFVSETLDVMRNRKKMLYLHSKSGLSDDPLEVGKSLHPASALAGNKTTYYYSLINDHTAYDIRQQEILSYKQYRQQLFNKN